MKPVNVCRALAAAVTLSAWTGHPATCTYTDGAWDTQPGENDDIVFYQEDEKHDQKR